MLDFFRNERCGRPLYLLLLALLFAFSFAAKPIERFLVANEDRAIARLHPLAAPLPKELPKSFSEGVGRTMGARNDKADEAAFREATGRFYAELPQTLQKAEEAQSSRFNIVLANMSIALVLSLVTVGVAVWMVFGRVNDIGWDSGWGIAFLAPWLVLNLYGAGMTDGFYDTLQRGFLFALFLLGLVPPAGREPEAETLPAHSQPKARAEEKPASFGRRRANGDRPA